MRGISGPGQGGQVSSLSGSAGGRAAEHQLVRSATGVSGIIMISRVLGCVRDMLFAAAFGATYLSDAFVVAFRIPNLLRRLFGEGGLSAGFIPVFTGELVERGKRASWELALAMINRLGVILVLVSAAGMLLAPQIMRVIGLGWRESAGQVELAGGLLRIMFPYIFFIGMAALASGILNSLRHFAVPALTSVILNVSMILFMVLAILPRYAGTERGVFLLAVAVIVGGAGQLLVQVPVLMKMGLPMRPRLVWHHPLVRSIGRLMIPAAVGLAVYEINVVVDTVCATFVEEGAPTALYLANRFSQLPLALIATSLATVIFPELSRAAARSDMPGVRRTVSFGLRQVMVLIIPAAVGLVVMREPIVQLLLQHLHFGESSARMTSSALLFYAMGLPFYGSVHILSRAFYSLKDTRTPMAAAAVAMVANVALDIYFVWGAGMGVKGLALATALSSVLNVMILVILFSRRTGGVGGKEIWSTCARVLLCSAMMAATVYVVCREMPLAADAGSLLGRVGAVAIPIGTGMAVFAVAAWLVRLREVTVMARAALLRGRRGERDVSDGKGQA